MEDWLKWCLARCFLLLTFLNGSMVTSKGEEFSLAKYSTAVYANNSVIDIQLVGKGFEGAQITNGGALECHTDDTTCCDNPDGTGKGEWYYPNGTVVPPSDGGNDTGFYRTRDHMVIRLNRNDAYFEALSQTGVYRCEIPGAEGANITRYITLSNTGVECDDLQPDVFNGAITYIPPQVLSANLSNRQRYIGTIAIYRCSPGYQLVGGSSLRACGPDGTWNGTEPSCDIDCGPLTDLDNGQVNISNGMLTTFGSTATYTCDTGYTLSGSQSRTCGADGNWSPSSPECLAIDCGPLTDPNNGQVNTSNRTTFGSTAIYTCDTGYTLSGSQSRTCGADGNWSPSSPECLAIDCGPLTDPNNGQVNTSNRTTFGSTATYTCDTGYTLSGSQSRTCGADGNWSPSSPECLAIDCGPLTDPNNGQVNTSNRTTFGSTATYTCDTGYTLSGSQSRTCGADGNWSPSSPECLAIDCGPLTDPNNGQVNTSNRTTFGSTAIYTCDTGYTLSGSQSHTCGADGNWSPSSPECLAIDCGPLTDPTNGRVNTSNGTTFGSTATYTCDTGYTLSGSQSRTCGADGNWSPSFPECLAIDCDPLTDPDNGRVNTSNGTTFGSTATYTCDTGYTLSGSQARTCGADGNWTFPAPVCISTGTADPQLSARIISLSIAVIVVLAIALSLPIIIIFFVSKKHRHTITSQMPRNGEAEKMSYKELKAHDHLEYPYVQEPYFEKHKKSSNDIIKPKIQTLQFSTKLSFIKPVEVWQVSSDGGQCRDDSLGLCIDVPEGAVSEGSLLQLKIGMCLCGPFKFPDGFTPIAPVLMLYPQNDIRLNKCLRVTVPHMLALTNTEDIETLNIRLMKASHTSSSEDILFENDIQESKLSFHTKNGCGFATVSLPHFCFISLLTTVDRKNAEKIGYGIYPLYRPLTSESGNLTYRLCVTYYMPPFLKAIEEKFLGDGGYILDQSLIKYFTMKGNNSSIRAELCDEHAKQNGWTATLYETGKDGRSQVIDAEFIDIWSLDQKGIFEMMLATSGYPPSFRINAHVNSPQATTSHMKIQFETRDSEEVKNEFCVTYSLEYSQAGRSQLSLVSPKLNTLCNKFGLTNDILDQKVSDKHILQNYQLIENWKLLAAHLHLTQADTQAIETEAKPDEKLMRLRTLQEWKKKEKVNGKDTYRVLIEALLDSECSESVMKVCEQLQNPHFEHYV